MTSKKETPEDRADRMAWKPGDLKVTKAKKNENETVEERRQRIAAVAKRLED